MRKIGPGSVPQAEAATAAARAAAAAEYGLAFGSSSSLSLGQVGGEIFENFKPKFYSSILFLRCFLFFPRFFAIFLFCFNCRSVFIYLFIYLFVFFPLHFHF